MLDKIHLKYDVVDEATLQLSALAKDLVLAFDDKVKTLVQNKLAQMGFKFKSDEEFFDFCKKRVLRVLHNGNDLESYYLELGETKTLIVTILKETIIKFEKNSISASLNFYAK